MRDLIDLAKAYRWTLVGATVAIVIPGWQATASGVILALYAFSVESKRAGRE